MKKIILLSIGILFSVLQLSAQNYYGFYFGINLPDRTASKYFNTGVNLGYYSVDIKLYKNLYFNTGLSISYNNRNPEYNFGIDDEPLLENNPVKENLENLLLPSMGNSDLFLLNNSLNIDLKYFFFAQKKLVPYLKAGFDFNYTVLKDSYFSFTFTEGNLYPDLSELKNNNYSGFNVGYHFSAGIVYKKIFIEIIYKEQPYISVGKYSDKVVFYSVGLGFKFPFNIS